MLDPPYKFHSESIGKGGIPLVMLHGFGESLESLKSLGLLLSESREVLLVDLPGFGKSNFSKQLIGAKEIAEALHSYLIEKGFQKIDLLGHSFGGKVSMMLSSLHPETVRKLVLVASSGLKRKRSIKEAIRFRSIKGFGKFIKVIDKTFHKKLFSTWFTPRFASSDYKHFPESREILIRSINENIKPYIASIRTPALLLWGALDSETPIDMGYRLKKMIKGSYIVVYQTLGHKPFRDVGCHLIKEHVEKFLVDPC